MTFREAVEAAQPPVSDAHREGKQALEGRHRAHVTCGNSRRLTGSVDLDKALEQEPGCASAPRWDYGFGYAPIGEPNGRSGSRFIQRRQGNRRCGMLR